MVEVGHPRAVVRARELAEQGRVHRVGRAVDMGGAAGAEDPLYEPALLVRGSPADQGRGAIAGAPEPVSDPPDRLVPGDRAEAAVAGADHRTRDPVVRVEHLEGEAAL